MATVDGGGELNPGGQPGADGQNVTPPAAGAPGAPQNQPVVGGDPNAGKFVYAEDRSKWIDPSKGEYIPRTRLNEESGKRTALETQNQTLKQQLELAERRVRAALGVETPDKATLERAETRQQLVALMKDLTPEERAELFPDLETMREAAESAEAAQQAQWERHGNAMLTDLEDEAADQLGVEKLTDAQKGRLRRAFKEEAREHAQARHQAMRNRDSSYDYKNDFVSRYERGDKTLLAEFAKAFITEWGIPARRSTVASEVRRGNRPVPRGERQRAPMTQQPPKIDYNNDAAFKAAMIAGRNGGGEV